MRSPLLCFALASLLVCPPANAQQSASPAKSVSIKKQGAQGTPSSQAVSARNPSSPSFSFLAAGRDDCSSPEAISGVGTFAFNQTTATTGTEGQNEYSCYAFGSSAIDNDVWFA